MARIRITISLEEEVFDKLEESRERQKISPFINDHFKKFFKLNKTGKKVKGGERK